VLQQGAGLKNNDKMKDSRCTMFRTWKGLNLDKRILYQQEPANRVVAEMAREREFTVLSLAIVILRKLFQLPLAGDFETVRVSRCKPRSSC